MSPIPAPVDWVGSVSELKMSAWTDRRVQDLMDRNNEGCLTAEERAELESLVELSEALSLVRARRLSCRDADMPEISRFYGIIIRMYYNDHNPPHFHAIYGSQEAVVGINPVSLLWGDLPGRALSMALEWAALHQQELQANWQRLRASQAPQPVAPLD